MRKASGAELQVASAASAGNAQQVEDTGAPAPDAEPAPSFDEDAELALLDSPGRSDDFARSMFHTLGGVFDDRVYWTEGMGIVRRPDPSAPDGFAYSIEDDF